MGRPASRTVGQSPGLTRRRLLAGASAVAATHALAACGRGGEAVVAGSPGVAGVDGGATVRIPASRLGALQVTDTLPPPPRPLRWEPGQFITHVEPDGGRRMMALTFDDGPSPANTYSVLRTLASFNVKATFYLIGVNVRSFPQIARDIVSEGHELGNHSVYHTPYRASPLAGQIAGNQVIIAETTGVTPVTHRAPGLTRGSIILSTCRANGVYEAHTHMSTFDWLSPRHSASALFNEFVRYHRNGAFALYHDGGGRRPTPDALPSIIRYALDSGYTFVPATALMEFGRPRPATFGYSAQTTSSRTADPGGQADDEAGGAVTTAAEWQLDDPGVGYIDCCRYDAEAELVAMLDSDDISLSRRDRSRIVEVLADIVDAQRD